MFYYVRIAQSLRLGLNPSMKLKLGQSGRGDFYQFVALTEATLKEAEAIMCYEKI